MSINSQYEPIVIYRISIVLPDLVDNGSMELHLRSEEELRAYNADPDLWASRRFGLTTEEYAEWIRMSGIALCAARTTSGRLCKNAVIGMGLHAGDWARAHRKDYCHVHCEASAR